MTRIKRGGPSTQPREPGAKACTRCQRMLPLGQYHRAPGVPDGRRSECKSCAKARRAARPEATRRHRERQRRAHELAELFTIVAAPDLPRAACLGKWALFDAPEPDEDDDDQDYRITRAKALCRSCPALDPCRTWLYTLPAKQRPSGVVAGQLITKGEP